MSAPRLLITNSVCIEQGQFAIFYYGGYPGNSEPVVQFKVS